MASSSAFSQWRSKRTARVSKLLESTQALKGESVEPEFRKKDLISVDLRYAQGFAFEESKISSIKTTRSINNQSNLKNCIDNKVSEKVVL